MVLVSCLHFSGKSKIEKNLPDEDAFSIGENCFSVFDGVPVWFADPYPNPSPGQEVAHLAAKKVLSFFTEKHQSLADVAAAFRLVNQEIKEYNEKRNVTPQTVDHKTRQYGAAVGCFGFVHEQKLFFGQLNDCGVMAFDKERNRELDIISNGATLKKYFSSRGGNENFDVSSVSEHVFFRSQIVNNPEAEVAGEKINFGVMTGEEIVENFLRIGVYPTIVGGLVLFFSDGFIPFVYDQTFIDCIFDAKNQKVIESFVKEKEKLGDRFKKEKTLIIVRF